jgi:hypothetical protein
VPSLPKETCYVTAVGVFFDGDIRPILPSPILLYHNVMSGCKCHRPTKFDAILKTP